MHYFDYNATSPMLPEARQAWLEAAEEFIGNPSSPHRVGARADAALDRARERLAGMLGCDALDIVWTSGATEAANLVLHHLARANDADAEVLVSSIEHPCVAESAEHHFGARLTWIPVERCGVISVEWLQDRLKRRRPACVIALAANNETGVLQPWPEVARLCQEHEVPLFCDATQWMGKLPAAGFGQCDFVCGSGHKFGGPRGVGFLKCPAKGPVEPLFRGGRQEEGRRAGTENVAGVLSMLKALELRERFMDCPKVETRKRALGPGDVSRWMESVEIGRRLKWRENFETQMLEMLSGAAIIGAEQPRLWNTVSAVMPEADCQQRWVVKLDKMGFAVSTGSACASGREEPSRVLTAMGYAPDDAGRVLRFSSGWETEEAEWNALLRALMKVAEMTLAKSGAR